MAGQVFPERISGGVRRLTTGIDGRGKSVIVTDEQLTGDERALLLWSADEPPRQGRSEPPRATGWWPPPGGIRISLSSRKPDREPSTAEAQKRLWPDINDAAGFHASDSVDIIVVISGRIWLELDDAVEVELAAGDVLVQNGTRHRWHNHGTEWPIIAVVIVGAAP